MTRRETKQEGDIVKKVTIALLLGVVLMMAACGEEAVVYEPEVITPAPADTYEETPATIYDPQPTDENDNENNTIENGDQTYNPELLYCNTPRDFALVYNGVTIQMDQDMDYLLPLLGEPLGVFEAPSCAFDGIDRIFGFAGIQIHTYPDGDLDRVHTISFLNDSITTVEGITLGNSWEDVLAAYGSDYEQDITMFTYTINRTTLSFFVEGDMVIGVIYGLIMD